MPPECEECEARQEHDRNDGGDQPHRLVQGLLGAQGQAQGQALELLGHAVEYLIDSRMFLTQVPYTIAEEEAVQILMALNRKVFESCPEVVTMRRRVTNGLMRWIAPHPTDGKPT